MNSALTTQVKNQIWILQRWWVQRDIKTSIHHQHLISPKNPHELRWILITIPARNWKSVWGQEKKSLRGTYNSHNPQLTWTSAQSEAAFKVRRDASTYINHERSHHKKNSNAHKRHSASACRCVSIFFFFPMLPLKGIHQIFLHIFPLFSMIHVFCLYVCFKLSSNNGSTGLCAQLFTSLSPLCVYSGLKNPWVNIYLAYRIKPRASKPGWPFWKREN